MTENPHYAGPPRSYHPADPRDLVDPETQAETNRRGLAECLQVLASAGITPRKTGPTPGHCAAHPDQPGGRTGAGDAYCPDCRRAESGGWRMRETVPDDVEPVPEEDR